MERVLKRCPTNNHLIFATVNWTPQFLQTLVNKFGINSEFTSLDVADVFRKVITKKASDMKLFRLYRQGYFKRRVKYSEELGIKLYFYRFSESAVRYHDYWMGFDYYDDSPLLRKYKFINERNKSKRVLDRTYAN
jgi:hypothetical protein